MKKIFQFLFISTIIVSCSGDSEIIIDTDHPEPPLKITLPANDAQFTIGDVVDVMINVRYPEKVKNLEIFVNDTLFQTGLKPESQSIKINSKNGKVGFLKIYVSYQDEKGETHGDTRTIVFFSDIIPVLKTAKKTKALPHNVESYTQGLEFYKGKLFEGTGHNGKSVLAEVDLLTGAHLRSKSLGSDIFGEGITILNDTIYQISWQNQSCFVYNMKFEPIREFNYTGEGWGLCNDGKSLIMSNGSSEIVWRNPRTFEIEKRLSVFSDQDSMEQLNELEMIDGHLYANIYGQNYIVEIDTANGKVISKIDCSEIETEGRVPGADVLNGIAYNPVDGKLYITGKWWPKLFEVTFE